MWLARVHVTLKPVVLDPQGQAVQVRDGQRAAELYLADDAARRDRELFTSELP